MPKKTISRKMNKKNISKKMRRKRTKQRKKGYRGRRKSMKGAGKTPHQSAARSVTRSVAASKSVRVGKGTPYPSISTIPLKAVALAQLQKETEITRDQLLNNRQLVIIILNQAKKNVEEIYGLSSSPEAVFAYKIIDISIAFVLALEQKTATHSDFMEKLRETFPEETIKLIKDVANWAVLIGPPGEVINHSLIEKIVAYINYTLIYIKLLPRCLHSVAKNMAKLSCEVSIKQYMAISEEQLKGLNDELEKIKIEKATKIRIKREQNQRKAAEAAAP